ncbi:MAG: DUF5812 family protein [Halobacteriaceae archaeon]
MTDAARDTAAGTFLVTHAESDSAVLRDVADGRVHALAENPDLTAGDVLVGDLVAGPMGATWTVEDERDRWTVDVRQTGASPPDAAVEAAADAGSGDLTVLERPDGQLHAIAVEGDADSAAGEVVADDATVSRAARLGAQTVEVTAASGVVAVYYRTGD